jgi:hypothetical protein
MLWRFVARPRFGNLARRTGEREQAQKHLTSAPGRDSEKGYLFCSRRHGHGKEGRPNGHRLSVAWAEEQITAKFQSVLTAAAVLGKVEEWTKLRREAKLAMSVDRRGLHDEQARLKGEIGKLVDALASVGATDEIKRAIEDRGEARAY